MEEEWIEELEVVWLKSVGCVCRSDEVMLNGQLLKLKITHSTQGLQLHNYRVGRKVVYCIIEVGLSDWRGKWRLTWMLDIHRGNLKSRVKKMIGAFLINTSLGASKLSV